VRTCKNGEPVDMIPTRAVPAQRLPAVRAFEYGTMTGSPPPQLRDVNVPGPASEAPAPVAR
jgi:hypothetical protein